MSTKNIIIAGGGTGGHIFPAIAVANAMKKIDPSVEILFVGAMGKMEMEKVPQAGFQIEGLDIAGFDRSGWLRNWKLPFKLIRSFLQVKKIFKTFSPNAVFGVGGYSSFPVLKYAQKKGIPTFLHEANSFAGKSNMLLARKAKAVMVATDGMEKFFPGARVIKTGNPVRSEIVNSKVTREEAMEFFGLRLHKPTVLIIGGSQGAKSINAAVAASIERFADAGIQIIWQTGKGNLHVVDEEVRKRKDVCITEFISKMNYAYAAADIVVSRAGAIAIAEICASGKPSILVPLPYAAEDHQRVNAMVLVNAGAAMMIDDKEVSSLLVEKVLELGSNPQHLLDCSQSAKNLFTANADQVIAELIIQHLKKSDA
jgi:UDP-N-acetylglucosamine--N-acetylmuramyl-(pentapeptide) pyrophosphoryl-undecaprenol N-acetylglucosamine transferase